MPNYIFKLVSETDQSERQFLCAHAEEALALAKNEMGLRLEFCDQPADYRLERGDQGVWKPNEVRFIRLA